MPWSPAAWITAIHFYLVLLTTRLFSFNVSRTPWLVLLLRNKPPLTRSVPLLRSLHWLPIKFRIEFKTCLLTYKTFNENQPGYLYAMLTPSFPFRSLRSNNGIIYNSSVPKVKTNTGARAFALVAPLCGIGSLFVRSSPSTASFKRRLKTHLFDFTFPP